jgi:hypothetical protein
MRGKTCAVFFSDFMQVGAKKQCVVAAKRRTLLWEREDRGTRFVPDL